MTPVVPSAPLDPGAPAAAVAAAVAAASAAWLLAGPARTPAPRPAGRARRAGPPVALLVAAVGTGGAAAASVEATRLALAAVLAGVAAGVGSLVRRARALRRAEERRVRVVDFCEALLGELRAGQPTVHALERSATVWPEAEQVAGAARLGADVPQALRRLASRPGAAAVGRLAAAWELCAATGTGLASAVEQQLETARAELEVARAVQGELASARATARLVAVLPLVVLVAAQGVGARPWQFLLQTPAGLACLAAGAGLGLAGVAWIDRIAARAATGEPS